MHAGTVAQGDGGSDGEDDTEDPLSSDDDNDDETEYERNKILCQFEKV